MERYKAMVSYIGTPNPGPRRKPLMFDKDDLIEVNLKEPEWWRGTTGDGQEGWFPQHLVQEAKQVGNQLGK